jgi:hypothetical protein
MLEPLGGRSQVAYLAVVTNKKRTCIVGPTSGSAVAFQVSFGARNVAAGKLAICARRLSIRINVRLPLLIA